MKILKLDPETLSPITQALFQREPNDWELHGWALDDLLATAGNEIAKLRHDNLLLAAAYAHTVETA